MLEERKKEFVKLLKNNTSNFSEALLYFLSKDSEEYAKKRAFVEKIIETYMDIKVNDKHTFLTMKKIPDEISKKIVASYEEEVAKSQSHVDAELIAEMNDIF